jgi:hypothetical protein
MATEGGLMIKTFCDICGNEIKTGEDYWRLSIYPAYNWSNDAKEVLLTCVFCKNTIFNFIQKIKEREQHEDS